MSITVENPLWARKPIEAQGADHGEHGFKRTLGPVSLVALGIGATTAIFTARP